MEKRTALPTTERLLKVIAFAVSGLGLLYLLVGLYELARHIWCNYFFAMSDSVSTLWCRLIDWDFRPDTFILLIVWIVLLILNFQQLKKAPYTQYLLRAAFLLAAALFVVGLNALEKALGPNPPNYF